MIQTVIFDLDGVIIDSEPIHFSVESELFREYDADISHEKHMSFVGNSSKNMWAEVKKLAKIKYSVDELVRLNEEKYLQYLNKIKDIEPIPGAKELINEIYNNKLNLVIASSSSRNIINTVIHKFSLTKYFSIVISGAELKKSKPDPEIFNVASKLSKTDPKECLVIEDSGNGIKAAKLAGMKCIAFKNPNSGKQDLSLADLVIDDFKDFDFQKVISELT